MTEKAKTLANRLRHGGIFTVKIAKRDGTSRQMRFSINPSQAISFAGADHSPRLSVLDLDAREYRTLRLDAVTQLTERKQRSLKAMKQITDSLF